jgi:glycosyltransferase involved in cell wall biosynthesis
MRVLHLYRPRLPGQRAQAIQVLHTCEALTRRGHQVTLLADRGEKPATAQEALRQLGLEPVDDLDLRIAPLDQSGLAGVWFRRELGRWWRGPPGVILARDKRRLDDALGTHGPRHRLILETHELDSALAADRGEDPGSMRALEARVASASHALVANCGGTLSAWEAAHESLPDRRRVSHNACSPSRTRPGSTQRDPVIRVLGSARNFKGVSQLLAMASSLALPVEWIGSREDEVPANAPDRVRFLPPLPYPEVPDLLARSQVLLLPLQDNRFGRSLTSPLKLWDYLATGTPIVAPDLPSVQEIKDLSQAPMHLYRPGDEAGLLKAIEHARLAPLRQPFLRTWDARAAELEDLFE